MTPLRSWAATHPGTRRSHNEDSFLERSDLGVWAVADGAGGHESGEVAARMVTEALAALPSGLAAGPALAELRTRIRTVHAALLEEAARRGNDVIIAATLVVLCVRGSHFACLWAGDARAYRLSDGMLQQLTHDHSLVQELIDAGQIPATAAERHPLANVVTRAIGARGETALVMDKVSDALRPGERLLLCSDGLTKSVPEPAIAALMHLDNPAEALIAAALERAAQDNVTAVVVQAPD